MITASHNPAPDNGVKLIDPRGEMLEAAWETYATTICNAPTPEELVHALESLVKNLKIDLTVKPSVVFGRDTRPSGKELTIALCNGFEAMGLGKEQIGFGEPENVDTADKGVITTPILHHIVRSMNTRGKGGSEEYGVPSVQGYYQKLAEAFKKLTVRSCFSFLPVLVHADFCVDIGFRRTTKNHSPTLWWWIVRTE